MVGLGAPEPVVVHSFLGCLFFGLALSVETRRSLRLTEEQRDRIADTLRLAEALGGEAITIPGGERSIADDVIDYARANNITQVIIGTTSRSRWFEILNGSVVHDLVRRSGNISVHVIAGDDIVGEPIPKKTVRTAEGAVPSHAHRFHRQRRDWDDESRGAFADCWRKR
jgi:K+-sensing histidine kinase KdpD